MSTVISPPRPRPGVVVDQSESPALEPAVTPSAMPSPGYRYDGWALWFWVACAVLLFLTHVGDFLLTLWYQR